MATNSANESQPTKPNLTVVSTRPRFPSSSDIDAECALANELQSDLVDRSRLAQLEDIARDSSFLGELIAGFVGDVDEILVKTDHAIRCENKRAIPDLMHSLKGAAVGVGAIKLAALATELDQSYEQLKILEISNRVADIKDCSAATSAFLRQYLQLHLH
jgi:HPt (histidine-containing phosphotransfer) domain-containing protein